MKTIIPASSDTVAKGEGKNLTYLGIPALNVDMNGNARPATGPWDIGAYQCGSAPITTITQARIHR